ncbi:Tetratricopeptide-like helical [Penicillium brevicompactum]|uniref:Tetratricopeptide-like helical n=1 Tax=Penicillium brevicompactum TaxID=5074 RepID=A0A9W9Q6D6_PENBR|nr:Tetratricopeptide-like helical [Penicillium brevicompactum]
MTSITPARPSLTSNDSAVLQALFDAESSPSSGITIDSSLPSWPSSLNISETTLAMLKERESDIIRKVQGEESPSQEDVKFALDKFDDLILQNQTYPSAYINRAQTLRLLADLIYNKETGGGGDPSTELRDGALFSPQTSQLCSRIFSDLGQAIKLATAASPADPVSGAQARLLADAHTHRGYLLLKAARVKKSYPEDSQTGPERLRDLTPDQLEEMASQDFFFGGRYGNKVAQQLAVQTNPYAKMCGAIVKEALKKELEG